VRPNGVDSARIAVALHDIEPATFERCALIRDWLGDHGVDRVTLLVIPARDLHPLDGRCPEMIAWLEDRAHAGDALAQHGFQHLQLGRAAWPRQLLAHAQGGASAEFVGLDDAETQRAVDAGRRVLKLAGLEPRGFVAPAYAYTPALRETLAAKFEWWAGLLRLHRGPRAHTALAAHNGRGRDPLAPVIGLGTTGPLKRALSPPLLRAGAMLSGTTLRLDLHPSDLEHTRHMLALEWVLQRCTSRRTPITYDDLVG
jgi:predicted deacetylase